MSYARQGVQAAKGIKDTDALAMAIALPSESTLLRFPTIDAPRTAVAKLKDQITITNSNLAITPGGFSAGDLLVAFYGQPGRLANVYKSLSTGQYQLVFASQSGLSGPDVTSVSWVWAPLNAVGGVTSLNTPLNAVGAEIFFNNPPHGKQMPLGHSSGSNYVFLNTNDRILVSTVTGTSTLVGNVTFGVFKWAGVDSTATETAITSLTFVNGNLPTGASAVVYAATAPGYYTIQALTVYSTAGVSSTPLSCTLLVDCVATAGWQMLHMGDLDVTLGGDPSLGEDCRLSASSMLATNTTALVNRQGTVLASRLRGLDALSVTPADLARSAEKYTGDASKGVYTFCEFSAARENFRNVMFANRFLYFNLDIDDYYHYIQITCPGGSTMANTYTVSFDNIIEFKTDSARYSKGVSHFDHQDLFRARSIVNANPNWFFENPLHMAALYNWVKRHGGAAIQGVRGRANAIGSAASMVDPAHAPLYKMLGSMLQL